jgi:hypothetical protein
LPDSSPYGSPACTVPFASPLTVPLDILKKSPKLHAAYDNRLPELPAIPQDVGHVLVHYLHTGTYQSLRPKPTDTMSKQICELRTSIQAYAAARTYDLPDLMRLAEAKIDKYGQGLPLPALLEVARDAYPTLTEGDDWFLDYLRSRIRPHLKDPKLLMGSNLLDQISSILSPNRVLLRTVLELFCERIVVRSEPATSPPASTIASPITSPGTSRPVSPLPPASPMSSLLEMRSRSVMRDEFMPARKNLKVTPWPSPDNLSEASWSRSMSPEPLLPEAGPPMFEAKPVPEPAPALAPFPELGPVILDVMPPPGPSIKAKAVAVAGPEVEPVPEPEVKIAIQPKTVAETESQIKFQIESDAEVPIEDPVKLPVEPELEAPVESPAEASVVVPVEVARDAPAEPEMITAVQAEVEQQEEAVLDPIPMAQRERKDSGKGIDLEPLPKELESIPEHVSELQTESAPQPQIRPAVLREADSGFWEGHDVESGGKESAPSIIELEPVPEPAPEPAHELESIASPKNIPGTDTRDFAGPDADIKSNPDSEVETEVDAPKEPVPEPLPTQESTSETATDILPRDLESQPEPEPLPITSAEAAHQKLADATTLLPEIIPAQEQPEMAQSKEVEAQPEPEKVEPLPSGLEQGSLLTIQQCQEETVEPEAVAKPEPEPQADSSDPVHLSDAAEPTGTVEPKAAQPSVEPGPKPAGKSEIQSANTDSAVHAAMRAADLAEPATVLGTKPAPEQEGAKTEADAADVQPCSAQVRQRSWKKRFLSLRYPVLFGRGM